MIGDDLMENQPEKEKRFLSPTDAAIFLSLSKPSLDRLVRRKEIPSYKIGGRRLFDREELVEWVKRHRDDQPGGEGLSI
jgi:excisionase family DNA binding protein